MVVGENPAEDVDDRWVALVAVETDMAARSHDRATDPQLTVFDAVYLFGQIDGGEHRFLNPFKVCRHAMLSQRQASDKEGGPGRRPGGNPQSRSCRHVPQPLSRAG